FSLYIAELTFAFNPSDALIHTQTLVLFKDVIDGDTDVESQVELRLWRGLSFTLQLTHSLLKHLRVEIESHSFDVATLLSAQQVARATEFKVECRDFESCAQVGEFFQGGKASAGDRREFDVPGN